MIVIMIVIVIVTMTVTMPSMTMSVSVSVYMNICRIIGMCVCHNLALFYSLQQISY